MSFCNQTYQPVTNRRNAHSCSTGFERPDFGSIDPANRGEGQSVNNDEEVRESNDRVGRRAGDLDQDIGVTIDTSGDIHAVRSQDATHNEMAKCHSQGSVNQKCSSTDLVHKEEHDRGEDDEQSILHSASNQVNVAREASHGEYVDNVICILC